MLNGKKFVFYYQTQKPVSSLREVMRCCIIYTNHMLKASIQPQNVPDPNLIELHGERLICFSLSAFGMRRSPHEHQDLYGDNILFI